MSQSYRGPRPETLGKLANLFFTVVGSERQSSPLVQAPMFINDCSACAKAIHGSFLLQDVSSSRLLSYRDQPTLPCFILHTVGLLVDMILRASPSGDLPDPRLSLLACHFPGVSLCVIPSLSSSHGSRSQALEETAQNNVVFRTIWAFFSFHK